MNDNDHPALPVSQSMVGGTPENTGISVTDLRHPSAGRPAPPTFSDYIPRVAKAVSAGTHRVYGTYWNRVIETWGLLPITAVTPLDISQLAEQIKTSGVKRKNARGGRLAAEHLISALRCMYKYAVAEGILT